MAGQEEKTQKAKARGRASGVARSGGELKDAGFRAEGRQWEPGRREAS